MELYVCSLKELFSVPTAPIDKSRVWAATLKEGEASLRRRRALRRVDRELEKGNYNAALSLVKHLKNHPAGLLRGFGAVTVTPKVPRSIPFLDGLTLAGDSEISKLQSVVDAILRSIKSSLEFQLQEVESEVLQQDLGQMISGCVNEDHLICMQHEAGHFLVGYMLGVFPRRYRVPSVQDLLQDRFARGKVEFLGFDFLRDVLDLHNNLRNNYSLLSISNIHPRLVLIYEVGLDTKSNKNFSRGKLNNDTLKKFSCVVLGGMASEHLVFGSSELLHSDVSKLDRVLKWLGFAEKEVDSETRQAAEAAVSILWCQSEARSKLAEAMALGRSVGFCIETIETALNITKL